MSEDIAIHADHNRTTEFFRQAKRLNMKIHGFLIIFRKQLNPAGIPHGHAIRMIVPDIDRRAEGAIGNGHDNGKTQSRRVIDGLGHEQKSLACRRGVGSRAHGRGADQHT